MRYVGRCVESVFIFRINRREFPVYYGAGLFSLTFYRFYRMCIFYAQLYTSR